MIGVRTPLGKKWHYAISDTEPMTYCGTHFSAGFDTIEDEQNLPKRGKELCQTCVYVKTKKRRRK